MDNLITLDPFGTEATRERALYRERQGDPVSEVIARSSNSYPRGGEGKNTGRTTETRQLKQLTTIHLIHYCALNSWQVRTKTRREHLFRNGRGDALPNYVTGPSFVVKLSNGWSWREGRTPFLSLPIDLHAFWKLIPPEKACLTLGFTFECRPGNVGGVGVG